MTDPDPPPPMTDAKGRFCLGIRLREAGRREARTSSGRAFATILAGITRSGAKKARKAGVNQKVDGVEFFIEQLVDGNAGAAATLIAKLIPPEPPAPEFSGPGLIVNVASAHEGQQFAPGYPDVKVLLPWDESGRAWTAYNGGAESWAAYLVEAEAMLTRKAFENLSSVPLLERTRLLQQEQPLLRLVPGGDDAHNETEAPSQAEARLRARLEALPEQEFARLVREFTRVVSAITDDDGDHAA